MDEKFIHLIPHPSFPQFILCTKQTIDKCITHMNNSQGHGACLEKGLAKYTKMHKTICLAHAFIFLSRFTLSVVHGFRIRKIGAKQMPNSCWPFLIFISFSLFFMKNVFSFLIKKSNSNNIKIILYAWLWTRREETRWCTLKRIC